MRSKATHPTQPRAAADLRNAGTPSGVDSLTPREIEVLELMSHGLTNVAIAEQLHVSLHTVKFHLGSIYRKLDVTNRTEAAVTFSQRRAEGAAAASQVERPIDGSTQDGAGLPAASEPRRGAPP